MDSKFFDIPFRLKSSDSDFICKDGELLKASNVSLSSSSGNIEGSLFQFPNENEVKLPPMPQVDFALLRTVLPGWHINADSFPSKTLVASESSMEYWNKLAAQLLSQFQSEAMLQNLFIAPFYAMAAWKTMEGAYLSASDPVLMIPNSQVPLVATDQDILSKELEFKIAAAVCGLRFKFQLNEELRDWVGKIKSLEILVSSPLQKYDTFQAFLPSRNVTTDSFCRSLDLTTGEISDQIICSLKLPLAWKANTIGMSYLEQMDDEEKNSVKYYRFASVPLDSVDLADAWCSPDEIGGRIFGMAGNTVKFEDLGKYSPRNDSTPTIIYGNDQEMEIITRPMKLSHPGNFKMVEKAFLRGSFNPDALNFNILASRDMRNWWTIASRKRGGVVILPKSCFRFYKAKVSGYLSCNDTLEGISFLVKNK